MNTRVDVLSVIDGLSALWRDESKIVGRWDSADELDSIRSAVAELIDRVDSYVTLGHSDTAYRELSAALARVKGV